MSFSSKMNGNYSGNSMEQLQSCTKRHMTFINELRNLNITDINLPDVVLIGEQSSGKSSVIEYICDVKLPKGTGTVTTCPLRLTLLYNEAVEWSGEISYLDKANMKIVKPEQVEGLVRKAQEEIHEVERSRISMREIRVKIESRHLPNMEIVDLPGLKYDGFTNDKKEDCKLIRQLITHYISNEYAVIVCVHEAKCDWANDEAFSIARVVDPNKERTFGVLSMADLVAPGEDREVIVEFVNSRDQMPKGYVAISCTSERNKDKNLAWREKVEHERSLFTRDASYMKMNREFWGIESLRKKISVELIDLINTKAQTIGELILYTKGKKQAELRRLENYTQHVVTQLMELNKGFQDCLMCMRDYSENNVFLRLRSAFMNEFVVPIDQAFESFKATELSIGCMSLVIRNLQGPEPRVFLNPEIYIRFIRKFQDRIRNIHEGILQKSETIVTEALSTMVQQTINQEDGLCEYVEEKCREAIHEQMEELRFQFEQDQTEELCVFLEERQMDAMVIRVLRDERRNISNLLESGYNEDELEVYGAEYFRERKMAPDEECSYYRYNEDEEEEDDENEQRATHIYERNKTKLIETNKDKQHAHKMRLYITAYLDSRISHMKQHEFACTSLYLLEDLYLKVQSSIHLTDVCSPNEGQIEKIQSELRSLDEADALVERFVNSLQ